MSIVIVNWNTRALLGACLASIRRLPDTLEREVIVVDNASRDNSVAMVKADYPEVVLVTPESNLGYAAGNNAGFALAKGEFILTLNPDTEFIDDSLNRALDIFGADPHAGALGAKQIGPDGEIQRSVRGFPSFAGIFGDVTGLGRRFPRGKLDSYRLSAFDYEKLQMAPQPMGTFLLLRRTALDESGDAQAPFDVRFPIFFNEVDLLLRLKLRGWHCLYAPDVRIKHHGGESTKQVRKSMIWESHRSLARFLWKHRSGPLAALGLVPLAAFIYMAAFVRARGYDSGFRA
ncbi:MAG: glycosyltransferase family 2 protein [Fimbriimonadaceae bacterium]